MMIAKTSGRFHIDPIVFEQRQVGMPQTQELRSPYPEKDMILRQLSLPPLLPLCGIGRDGSSRIGMGGTREWPHWGYQVRCHAILIALQNRTWRSVQDQEQPRSIASCRRSN